jgi:hypothetical protein
MFRAGLIYLLSQRRGNYIHQKVVKYLSEIYYAPRVQAVTPFADRADILILPA